ncbi:type II secretion system protein GspM [Hydrogenophaga sp.]|uniref:type II secretion system protein GspM n=1 Tax=Hydrogenophaga sp. TaxID=1904254 RepID=UPI00272FFE7F|nr:type II secretion system protein GspM [Hydrogenophaga sp.]MDP2017732.1 type II secretion system protein GspM [Hydrogenophaga sp.]MDP3811837.1 type II secretion system protein GspM [Hydrogenophaga sp.]
MATRTRIPFATRPLARYTAPLSAALDRLSPRERKAVLIAGWVVGLGLLWWLAVAPALSTLREAPERHARLNAQLSQMQRMAATASALRSESDARPPGREAVLRALEAATASLGTTAQLSVLGERATATLRGTAPTELAQWLAQVRINARLLPLETRLTRDAATGGWNGTVVLSGPGLGG